MSYITVVKTEAYAEEKSNSHASGVMNQLSDWWEAELENDGEYEASFSHLVSPTVPEDALSMESLSDRRSEASEWLENNYSNFDSRTSLQILDWVEEDGDGWPLGNAHIGTAETGSTYKTGITNVYRFENPSYYFSDVGEEGTAFHEMLHNYSVLHDDGAVNYSDEGSFILSATNDEDDDTCYWIGDQNIRTDWTSYCTRNETHDHIDDNS